MSLRYEQYRSLKRTREFLFAILGREFKRVPKEVRAEASRCLKHYPFLNEDGAPIFSNDTFSPRGEITRNQ